MASNKNSLPILSLYIIGVILALICLAPSASFATPEYSERTDEGCMTCHLRPEGGALTKTGLEYAASGYVWPPKGGYRVLGPIRKTARLFIGLLHITSAFLWFGTILYVHLLLRPAYAAKGLPKGEVFLGMASMAVVGITGALLTISRIKSLAVLWQSHWGVVLSIKVILYVLMVSSAAFVVAFIGPKLKKGMVKAMHPKDGVFDPLTLSGFDGREGRPAYIAFKGKVYDMGGLKLWKGGVHAKHSSGEDLTDSISKAPHGEEKLGNLNVIGSYDASLNPPLNQAQKAFYFIAYMNLAIVFLVLFTIAFWRWGL